MKIGFFIYHLNGGGAERVITNLANEFSRKGHTCLMHTVKNDISFYPLDEGVIHESINKKQKNRTGLLGFVLDIINYIRLLKKDKPDVVLSFIGRNNLIAIITCRFLRIPVIISERSNPESYITSFFQKYLHKTLYKRANLIVLQTNAVLRSFSKLGVKLPKAIVLANPLSNEFSKVQNEIKKEKIILSIGRLSYEKGHDFLLESLLKCDLNGWKVKIVGDGPLFDKYRQYIIDNDLSASVTLEGRKVNVLKYYDEASVFVLPSRSEGFPNAIIEAMSRKCVVVSTDCKYGPTEIIKEGENGFLVHVGDIQSLQNSLEKLCHNKLNLEEISNEAFNTANSFRIEKVSNDWLDEILRVLR